MFLDVAQQASIFAPQNGVGQINTNGGFRVGGPMLESVGTAYTASGCSYTTILGGGFAGSYHSGTTGTCTVTVTFSGTANNGYSCWANDLTTTANVIKQTATTTTTATLAGTTASGDIVNFGCIAY
jgi:hypothetical protein